MTTLNRLNDILNEELLTLEVLLKNVNAEFVALLDKEGNVVVANLLDDDLSRIEHGETQVSKVGDDAELLDGAYKGGSVKFHKGELEEG